MHRYWLHSSELTFEVRFWGVIDEWCRNFYLQVVRFSQFKSEGIPILTAGNKEFQQLQTMNVKATAQNKMPPCFMHPKYSGYNIQ